MSDLIDKINSKNNLYYLGGVSEELIESSEDSLQLSFSPEYKTYLKEFGVASFDGHEFTGICSSKRLNVVNVTNELRKINNSISVDMYVIEELNIDSVVILQNSKGTLYQASNQGNPRKIADSILEYIS